MWFNFTPSGQADPWYDQARIFYFIFCIPLATLGVLVSTFILNKGKLNLGPAINVLAWSLLIVSICTVIPPVFKIARYIFYPVIN